MDFFPVLENKRVCLRPLQATDIDLLKPVALAQPQLFRLMSAAIHTEADLNAFIQQALTDREQFRSIPFLAWDKQYDCVAGSTRFGNLDGQHKRTEIGWTWLDERLHGSGLNKAMKYLMLRHAFDTLGLNRIEIKTNEQNRQSRRAIEGIGGIYEGCARHHMVNADGSLRNTVYYSILKEEWPGIRDRVFAPYLKVWY